MFPPEIARQPLDGAVWRRSWVVQHLPRLAFQYDVCALIRGHSNSSSVSPHDSIFRIPLRRQLALELLNRTDSNLVESSTPANGTEVVPRQARDIAFRLDSP